MLTHGRPPHVRSIAINHRQITETSKDPLSLRFAFHLDASYILARSEVDVVTGRSSRLTLFVVQFLLDSVVAAAPLSSVTQVNSVRFKLSGLLLLTQTVDGGGSGTDGTENEDPGHSVINYTISQSRSSYFTLFSIDCWYWPTTTVRNKNNA